MPVEFGVLNLIAAKKIELSFERGACDDEPDKNGYHSERFHCLPPKPFLKYRVQVYHNVIREARCCRFFIASDVNSMYIFNVIE
jgi:hypothetical protein